MDKAEREAALRREKRRVRRLWACWGLGALGLLSMLGGVAIFQAWPEYPGLGVALGVIGFLLGIGMVVASFALSGRYVATGDTMRLQGGSYRDKVQRERARSLAFMPVTALFLTYKSAEGAWLIAMGAGEFLNWLMAAMGPLMSALILLMVAGLDNPSNKRMKRLLEDELTLSFRAKALNAALATAMVGLLVVFGLGLWRSAAAVASIPVVFFLSASTAGLRYYVLDSEAEIG